MGIIIALAVNALVWGVGYLWRKYGSEQQDPKKFVLDIPRVETGAEIPLAWGRVLVRSPIAIWLGNQGSAPVNEFVSRYLADVHYVLCHTNRNISDDQGNAPSLVSVWGGDKPFSATSEVQSNVDWTWYNVSQSLGGIGAGGTLSGFADIYYGSWSQNLGTGGPPSTTDSALLYKMTAAGHDTARLPHYQGLVSVFLYKTAGGFEWGESPVLAPVAYEIINPVAIPGVNQSLMEIGEGDANPAGVLYDILTNDEGGRLGYPAADVDANSFGQAALVLWVEQNGFSHISYRAKDAQTILEMVLRQIDGVLYEDPTTSKWTLKLVREESSVGTDLFTEDEILRVVDHEVVTWLDTANTLRVKYEARRLPILLGGAQVGSQLVYKQDVVEQMDQATAATKALVVPMTIEYPGVTTSALAARLAARDLRALGQPLVKMQLQVGRAAFFYEPMRVIRVKHPRWQNRELVMRVVKVDLGDSSESAITLDLLQDKWAVDYTIQTPPDVVTVYPNEIVRIRTSVLEEAPRFYLGRAQALGFGSVEAQRAWYLAAQPDTNDGYKGSYDDGSGDFADTQMRPYMGTFVVDGDYVRTTSSYDTTVGIQVRDLVGWSPAVATEAQVRQYGQNVLYLNGEMLAFLSYTDLGGGTFLLEDILRGLGDTTPQDHVEGDPGFFVSKTYAPRAVGLRGFDYGDTVDLQALGVNDGHTEDPELAQPSTAMTVTLRNLRPYPVGDLKVSTNGAAVSRAPAAMTVEGIDATWKRRSRLNDELVRGDDADESPPDAGTTYRCIVQKENSEAGYPNTFITGMTGTGFSDTSLSSMGWGDLRVGIRTRYTATIGGSGVFMDSWQDHELPIRAYEWRNLLLNPFMHDGTNPDATSWSETTNDLVPTSTGPWLATSYATGDGVDSDNEWRQDVITTPNWHAVRMRVILDFYVKSIAADSNDTVQVKLVTSDGGTDQDTQTYGPSSPTTSWVRQTLSIASASALTTQLSVRGVQDAVDPPEPDSALSAVVGGFQLRCGQITDQLLSNPTFASGLTGWTTSQGAWSALSTTPFIGAEYIGGSGSNATQELYQEVSVTAGYNSGYAVVSCLVRHPGPSLNTTAHLTVEARDSGGTILATGTASVNPLDVGNLRLEAFCIIPETATVVRGYLKSTRNSGTSNATEFDDVDLRLHKYLDPSTSLTLDFQPSVQDMPTRRQDWQRLYPDVPVPAAVFDGLRGGLGTEPDVDVQAGAYRGAKLPLLTSDGAVTVSAYEFKRSSGGAVRVRSQDFGNFSTAQSFTVRVVASVMETGSTCGLIGHTDGTTGWKLELTSGGDLKATLLGSTATKTVTSTVGVGVSGTRWYGMSYDADTSTLRVHVDNGSDSVSTSGMGEIACYGVNMYLGGTEDATDTFTGLARYEIWNEYVTQADQASMWAYGDPGFSGSFTSRGPVSGAVACVVGEDDEGVVVGWFGSLQIPHVWSVTNQRYGLGCASARENLADWDLTSAAIRVDTTCTEVAQADQGPDGRLRASKLTGTSSTYMVVQVDALSATATVNVVFFARADVAHTMSVALTTTVGAVQETIDVAVTAVWRRYNVKFTAWGGGVDDADVRFIPSNDGISRTVYVSGPWFVDQATTNNFPSLLHVSGGDATTYLEMEGLGLSTQYNHEGEIVAEVDSENADVTSGTIFLTTNGSNQNDERTLTVSSSTAVFDHYTGAAATVASESGSLTWTDLQTLRCRWQQLGLLEAATAFAGIRWGAGSDYDRTATWTPGTVGMDFLQVGSGLDGVVYSLTLRARERIL